MSNTVNLSTCDSEPIHTPGSIQAHGCLLVCDFRAGRILRHSANAKDVLGLSKEPLSLLLSDVFAPSVVHDLMNTLSKSTEPRRAGLLFDLNIGSRSFNVACHSHKGMSLFEFEPISDSDGPGDPLDIARTLISKTQALEDLGSVFKQLPRFLHALLGYDRVMLYQFAEDGSGKVVGEAKSQHLESFLGQHFPAADIPRQARILYMENTIRIIGDARGNKSEIVPELDPSGTPLDLSFAHLRSVSPIHLEYLRNMGVAASMSISIIVSGRLWGLVACHHYSPKVLTMSQRVAAELFGDFLSLHLTSLGQRVRAEATLRARSTLDRILTGNTFHEAVDDFLRDSLGDLSLVVPCDGVGLWMRGTWSASGAAPPSSAVPRLARLAAEQCDNDIWACHSISETLPDGSNYAAEASGLLAVPLSMTQPDFLFFFRKEKLQTLDWAGDPKKTYSTGPNGERLTPRASFSVWKQTVERHSDPWTEDDRAAATSVLIGLREVVMRHSEIMAKERRKAEVRMKVLNDELNHRVKNILSLMKSLVKQPTNNVESVSAFVEALKGRILALAHAHDQVVRSEGGGTLLELVRAELSPYPSQQIRLNGPGASLDSRAYSVMALVIHELATNAAKYGALSTPEGTLEVNWAFTDRGLWLRWEESGGPPVREPTRQGFGSVLLSRSVPFDLQGSSEVEYPITGVVATIEIPSKFASAITSATASDAAVQTNHPAAPEEKSPTKPSFSLTGLNGLLVEDQLVIALEAEDMLRDIGVQDISTVSSAARALQLIAKGKFDFAVLDVNLGSHNSLTVADELKTRGVPFIFATGYGDSVMIPQHLKAVPIVRKPYTGDAIRNGLADACLTHGKRV